MSDVNVTEKVADRIARARGYVQGACVEEHYRDAREALAVLSDPEVLAGIAGVLRDTYARTACGGDPTAAGEVSDWLPEAAAVADWIRGWES